MRRAIKSGKKSPAQKLLKTMPQIYNSSNNIKSHVIFFLKIAVGVSQHILYYLLVVVFFFS